MIKITHQVSFIEKRHGSTVILKATAEGRVILQINLDYEFMGVRPYVGPCGLDKNGKKKKYGKLEANTH